MRDYIEYTADNEEPMCVRCDNINWKDEWCSECCGSDKGWAGYRRTEKIEDVLNKWRLILRTGK